MDDIVEAIRKIDSIYCQDGECDTCPEYWESILLPGQVMYVCSCTCHE